MKAIKIDVVTRQITEIEIPPGLPALYKALECDIITCISPNGFPYGDVIYIDDEGLLKQPPIGAFSVKGYSQVLSGHGIILGTDEEGESTSCKIKLDTIIKLVRFEDTHYLPNPGFTIIHL